MNSLLSVFRIVNGQQHVGRRERSRSASESRSTTQRRVIMLDAFANRLLAPLLPFMAAEQIEIVSLRIDCRHRTSHRRLIILVVFRLKLDLQRLYDGHRNLVLHFENIGQPAIISFRPQVITRVAVDQLRGNAHIFIARPTHAALQNRIDTELPRNISCVHAFVAVGK